MSEVYSCLYSRTAIILWSIRIFLYLTILTLSLAIVGIIGRKEDNVWNTSLIWDQTSIDFCAYNAKSITAGETVIGNHHTCPYVVALSSLSSIFYFVLLCLTLLEAWQIFLSKYWIAEFLIDIFFFWWWLIGSIIVTSQRPSSQILSSLSLAKFVNAVEGLSWCNFALCFLACIAIISNGYLTVLKFEESTKVDDYN